MSHSRVRLSAIQYYAYLIALAKLRPNDHKAILAVKEKVERGAFAAATGGTAIRPPDDAAGITRVYEKVNELEHTVTQLWFDIQESPPLREDAKNPEEAARRRRFVTNLRMGRRIDLVPSPWPEHSDLTAVSTATAAAATAAATAVPIRRCVVSNDENVCHLSCTSLRLRPEYHPDPITLILATPLVPIARIIRLDDDGALGIPLADPSKSSFAIVVRAFEPAAIVAATTPPPGEH